MSMMGKDKSFHQGEGNWFSFLDLMRECHSGESENVLANEKTTTEKKQRGRELIMKLHCDEMQDDDRSERRKKKST